MGLTPKFLMPNDGRGRVSKVVTGMFNLQKIESVMPLKNSVQS